MSRWTFPHMPVHMITTLLFDLPADLSRKIEGPLLAGYMITVGDFQSDCRKCNPIKSSKVNGDGKKHRSMPEVWSNAFIK